MWEYKERTGQELKKEARRLGLSEENWYNADGTFREAAIQGRVRDANRARREIRLWIATVISLLSTIAAWIAALK